MSGGYKALKQTYKTLKQNPSASEDDIKAAKKANKTLKTNSRKRPRHHDDNTHESHESLSLFQSFSTTPFHPTLVRLLKESYHLPTPVQSAAWSHILGGDSLVAVAKTGSGKTCAYILPLLHSLSLKKEKKKKKRKKLSVSPPPPPPALAKPVGLVVAPVRELALQIHETATRFGTPLGVRCCCLYGGTKKRKQVIILHLFVIDEWIFFFF
jgi:ATP-dependent RNA helicase DDX5/DBP2